MFAMSRRPILYGVSFPGLDDGDGENPCSTCEWLQMGIRTRIRSIILPEKETPAWLSARFYYYTGRAAATLGTRTDLNGVASTLLEIWAS